MSRNPYRPAYGVFVFTAAQFIALALSFLGGALMVRMATPETVGSYLLLLQAITALTLLMQVGLAPATLRFVPMARGRGGLRATSQLRTRLAVLLLCAWSVLALPVVAFWPYLSTRLNAPELAPAGMVIFGGAALLALNQVIEAYIRSFRRYGAAALAGDILPRAVTSLGFVLLFLSGDEVDWPTLTVLFLAGNIVAALAFAGALITTTSAEENEDRSASPVPALREVLTTALTMGLRAGTAILMAASAIWVLSWARPHEEVAVYGMMVGLLQLVGLVPNGVARVVTQEFAPMHADGRRAALERLVRSSATVTGIISLLTFLLLAVVGKEIIRVAYGPDYVGGWVILMVLAAGTFIDSAFGLAGFLLQMTGYHRRLFVLSLAAALVNLVLSILLVRPYGGVGVAVANTSSLVLLNVAMVLAVKNRIGIRTVAYLQPAEWSAIAMRALNMASARRSIGSRHR